MVVELLLSAEAQSIFLASIERSFKHKKHFEKEAYAFRLLVGLIQENMLDDSFFYQFHIKRDGYAKSW